MSHWSLCSGKRYVMHVHLPDQASEECHGDAEFENFLSFKREVCVHSTWCHETQLERAALIAHPQNQYMIGCS